MSTIMNHFETIVKIPRCSKEADKFCNFLIEFAKDRGYEVEVDKAQNIFIHKGSPTLSLQAHYDMVCMGKAPFIETYVEDGWMMAKDSSLGADNAIAIAMMMQLMEEGEELEFLLTSDEEIGLIGANQVEFDIKSQYMLNLDSEEDGKVCIGCAGGVDIIATKDDVYVDGVGSCYEVSVKGLQGGHSGVDIDKNIPSAIKVLAKYLRAKDITQLSSLYGGERRNSIPSNAVAIIYSDKVLESKDEVAVRKLKEMPKVLSKGGEIIEMLDGFKDGVYATNEDLSIPDVSINLAIVQTDERGGFLAEFSARAMGKEELEDISAETTRFLNDYGFSVKLEEKYPSWKPEVNSFTSLVATQMKEVFGKAELVAIHAGLECGVIAEKYPHINFASMGPNIKYPHSKREMVEVKSVDLIFKVLKKIIKLT